MRALFVLTLIFAFSHAASAAYVVSRTDSGQSVRITQLADQNLRFEVCVGKINASTCTAIGDENGYPPKDIANRIIQLNKEHSFNTKINIGITVLGLVGGAVGGALIPVRSYGGVFDFSALARLWDSGKFAFIGGISGTGIAVFKHYFVDKPAGKSAKDLSVAGGLASSDTVFVVDEPMSSFIKNLNYALMD